MNEIPENLFTEVKCSLFMLDLPAVENEPDSVERDSGSGLTSKSIGTWPQLWSFPVAAGTSLRTVLSLVLLPLHT